MPVAVDGLHDGAGPVEVGGRARADEQPVLGEEGLDVTGECDPAVVEHDQVVADALQLVHDVGGEQDGHPAFGDRAHEDLQELMSGQRVEAGHRLVEDEQVRPLRQGQGQRHLGLLPAGERTGSAVERDAQLRQPAFGQPLVEPQVAGPAEAEHLGDGEALVQRVVLGQEPDPGQGVRGAGGDVVAEDLHRAGARCQQPDDQAQQRGLARAVRPDQGDHAAGRQGQGAVAQRPALPVPLAHTVGAQRELGRCHATSSFLVCWWTEVKSALTACSSRPAA